MTPTLTPNPDALLARAARLRAQGLSWDAAARELDTTPDALETLARAAGREYRDLLREARREVGEEAFAEAVFALRRELRSKDDKARREAADSILRLRMTHIRHHKRAAAPALPPLSSENERLVRFLDGYSDEDLERLCEDLHGPVTPWRPDDDPPGGPKVPRDGGPDADPSGGRKPPEWDAPQGAIPLHTRESSPIAYDRRS